MLENNPRYQHTQTYSVLVKENTSIKQEIMEKQEMLTVKEAADALGLAVVTLRSWAARRKIAIHRLGRAVRVSRSEVQRLLDESLVPARPER